MHDRIADFKPSRAHRHRPSAHWPLAAVIAAALALPGAALGGPFPADLAITALSIRR